MRKTTSKTVVKCDGETCFTAGIGPAWAVYEVFPDALNERGWLISETRDLCPKCVRALDGADATDAEETQR